MNVVCLLWIITYLAFLAYFVTPLIFNLNNIIFIPYIITLQDFPCLFHKLSLVAKGVRNSTTSLNTVTKRRVNQVISFTIILSQRIPMKLQVYLRKMIYKYNRVIPHVSFQNTSCHARQALHINALDLHLKNEGLSYTSPVEKSLLHFICN